MKKIIPFKKDIIFNSKIEEITSISLEHTLQVEENNVISGKFIVSGDYLLTNESRMSEPFSYELPFLVSLDDRYILDNVFIDIDDFYYEIINENVLSVNIDVLVDKLEEQLVPELEERIIEREDILEEETQRCVEEETPIETVNSLFDNIDNSNETFKSYSVYIVRENDSIESIVQKYEVTKEQLMDYNDLSELKIGDKIIIPS